MEAQHSSADRAGAAWRNALAPLQAWWVGAAARERWLVAAAVVVVALFALWMIAVRPAWRTLREVPKRIDALDVQWQAMQRQAAEVRELRATTPLTPTQADAALKAASERLGDKGRLVVQGDRAVLTLTNASGEQLRGWLAEARSAARARPVEATLARAADGYSGTIVVMLGARR